MKKLLITSVIATVMFSTSAVAEEPKNPFKAYSVDEWSYTISHNFFTIHRHSDTYTDSETGEVIDWNEDNNVTGFRINVNENLGYFVAKGVNSYYEDTTLGGIELSTSGEEWDFGSDVGLASGYEELFSTGIIPFVNPFIRYSYNFNEYVKASVKVGSVNFMAENAHFELTMKLPKF